MKGHPIRGFFAGLLLGICLDLDLALGGVVKLDRAALSIVLVVSIVVCFILGFWAPIGRYSKKKAPARATAAPLPPPAAWPEFAPTEGSNAPSPQAWNAPPEPKPEPPSAPAGDEPSPSPSPTQPSPSPTQPPPLPPPSI
jgi:hypothetical protein